MRCGWSCGAQVGHYQKHISHPDQVAAAVLDMLTRRRPPPHKRVGRGSLFMRSSGDLVPERIWDWAAGRVLSRA